MKKVLSMLASICISFSAFSMDKYSTAGPGAKSVIENVIKELKISEKDIAPKIYDELDFIFEKSGEWNSYWFGYQELAASKIENTSVTFIEYFFNTEEKGMYIISFMYDSISKQILLSSKQIRYGEKQTALDAFKEKKDDSEKYNIQHESGNYALVQTNNKVKFAAFNIGPSAGSVVYMNQTIIQL